MKTVEQYITDASTQLNDQYLGREFTRWTRASLLMYLNGALSELSSHKPETFLEHVTLPLVAGRRQSIADTYKSLVSIDTNADGSQVHESDIDLIRTFSPYSCCAGEVVFDSFGNPDFTVKSYAIDPKDTKSFYVSPEIPTGIAINVSATVTKNPVKYVLADVGVTVPVDSKYEENIMDYILGRAYDIDSESAMSRSNADKHLVRFYTAMGIKYRVESAYRAGNYNGAVGDGDPRARL